MRPGQQHNKRGRGRNRRHNGGGGGGGSSGGGNPLNRVYESNGPDVKVRGTAQTVADKYLQLGRDAQVSGDIVMAESYFQHAEHYLRILVAAQAYQQQLQPQFGDDDEMEAGGEGDDSQPEIGGDRSGFSGDGGDQPDGYDQGQERYNNQQNPRGDYQQGRPQDQQGRDRNDRNRGNFRPRWENRRDQGDQQGRYNNQQNNNQQNNNQQNNSQPNSNQQSQQPYQPRREEQPQPIEAEQRPQPEAAAVAPAPSVAEVNGVNEKWDGPQPSFLKRPATGRTRRPRRETAAAADDTAAPASPEEVPQAD